MGDPKVQWVGCDVAVVSNIQEMVRTRELSPTYLTQRPQTSSSYSINTSSPATWINLGTHSVREASHKKPHSV